VMATHERRHLDRALEAFERVRERIPEDLAAPEAVPTPGGGP